MRKLAIKNFGNPGFLPGWAIAFLLLFYFALPNTLWQRISPITFVTLLPNKSTVPVCATGIILYVILTLLFLYFRITQYPTKQKAYITLFVLTALYLATLIVALLSAHEDPIYFKDLFRLLLASTTGLLVTVLLRQPENTAAAIGIIALMQGGYTLYYTKMGINTLLSGNVLRAGGTFDHPVGVYTLMMLALPLAITVALIAKNNIIRLLFLCSASVIFASLMLTWYRGGILGMSVGLTCLSYFLSRNFRLTIVVGICLALITLVGFTHRTAGVTNLKSSERSVQGRYRLWGMGWELFRQNWITGVGVDAVKIPIESPTADPHVTQGNVLTEPKNLFLHWLGQFGVSGGILFLAFALAITASIKDNTTNPIRFAIGASWITLMVAGMFDTPFGISGRPFGNALVGCLLGATILLAQNTMLPEKSEVEESVT